MVLGAAEREHGLAVAKCEEAGLLADEQFLDDHARIRLAVETGVKGRFGLGIAFSDGDAFASGKPISLDDHRGSKFAGIGKGSVEFAEIGVVRGRDAMFGAESFGEALGTFKLRRGLAWAESLDVSRA